MRAGYGRLRPASQEDSVLWLRKKLAQVGVEKPPKPRRSERWLGLGLPLKPSELQDSMTVLLRVAGVPWAGEVLDASETTIWLRAWGVGERLITLDAIEHARTLPEHTWAEARLVGEEQRRRAERNSEQRRD